MTSSRTAGTVAGDRGDRLAEDPQGGRHLGLADGQGRAHPDRCLAAFEDQQAALEAGPLDLLGVLAGIELDADHQALATNVADEPVVAVEQRPETGHRLLAADRGVLDQAAFEQLDRRERRGAGDRVAAIGRAVRARTPGLEQLGPGDHARRASSPRRCPWR